MTSSVYQFAPVSGSEAVVVRRPSGKPRSLHSVFPPGPTIAISLTGVVSKAARRQTVERGNHLRDAEFGERDGALGRGLDLLLALPIDQAAQPEVECEQGSARQHYADDDRKNILAREGAH